MTREATPSRAQSAAPLRDLLAECAQVDRLRVQGVHVAADVALAACSWPCSATSLAATTPPKDQFVGAVVDQVLTGLLEHSWDPAGHRPLRDPGSTSIRDPTATP